jgi:hypothetical protein
VVALPVGGARSVAAGARLRAGRVARSGPTRLRAAGLLAGAVGAFGYAFACIEQSTAFVALWYSLGIGMSGALGAALGPRVLRW